MYRSALCEISQIDEGSFRGLRHRGELPFEAERYDVRDGRKRKWARYDVHAAAALIAARELYVSQGLAWREACLLMRAPTVGCGSSEHRAQDVDGIHVARVTFADPEGLEPSLHPCEIVYRGRLDSVVRAALSAVSNHNEKRPNEPPIHVGTITAVDVSAAYALARARMQALGIAQDDDQEAA